MSLHKLIGSGIGFYFGTAFYMKLLVKQDRRDNFAWRVMERTACIVSYFREIVER